MAKFRVETQLAIEKAAAAGATADDIDAAIEALEEAGDETTAKTMRIMAGRLRAM